MEEQAKPKPKGRTNNPRGRPPKGRALTEVLTVYSLKKVTLNDKSLSRAEHLAGLVWGLALEGKTVIDGQTKIVKPSQQIDMIKFIYTQIDGPVKIDPNSVEVNVNQSMGLTTEDEAAFDRIYKNEQG